jgi:hypothetical protein
MGGLAVIAAAIPALGAQASTPSSRQAAPEPPPPTATGPFAPDLKATSDAQALALLGSGAAQFASNHGVDIFSRAAPLSVVTRYALACAATCTVSAHARLTLSDRQGDATDRAVPGARVILGAGEARLISIRLAASQVAQMRRAARASLAVTFVVSPPAGR